MVVMVDRGIGGHARVAPDGGRVPNVRIHMDAFAGAGRALIPVGLNIRIYCPTCGSERSKKWVCHLPNGLVVIVHVRDPLHIVKHDNVGRRRGVKFIVGYLGSAK
jgi:hypothetical protein